MPKSINLIVASQRIFNAVHAQPLPKIISATGDATAFVHFSNTKLTKQQKQQKQQQKSKL